MPLLESLVSVIVFLNNFNFNRVQGLSYNQNNVYYTDNPTYFGLGIQEDNITDFRPLPLRKISINSHIKQNLVYTDLVFRYYNNINKIIKKGSLKGRPGVRKFKKLVR